MSLSSQKIFLQQLIELHNYLRFLGSHVNQIYNHLENIERKIKEMNEEQRACIETNTIEFEKVKGAIVTKSEVNDLLQELNKGIKGSFPILPELERPTKESKPKEKKEKTEEPKKEEKKRRFPFLPRF